VLPIGGLKEKLLAAHRGGIKTVLIPNQNVKDLADIPENIKNHLDIHPVQWIDEVLALALASQPVPLPEISQINETPAKEVQVTDKSVENITSTTEGVKH
jgi:ATP-dependent Lon protease